MMKHSRVVSLKELQVFCASAATKLSSFAKSGRQSMKYSCQFICQTNPLFIHLTYFTLLSFAGYEALKVLKSQDKSNTLKDLDLLFTSVSASTVSSMATVEMEDFSSTQLWILAILMLIGSEVFTSILGLHFMRVKFNTEKSANKSDHSSHVDVESINAANFSASPSQDMEVRVPSSQLGLANKEHVDPKTIEFLGTAVMAYLLIINLGSLLLIYIYLKLVPDAQEVLKRKGIGNFLFSVFTAISSVANCGFTPVNENMVIFQKNSFLLLLIIPQILVGNTLFAPCLRSMVWTLKKITGKEECHFILQHPKAIGCRHLMSTRKCVYLVVTVVSFIILQTILFCSLEWSSEALQEMSSYQKIVGSLFQSTNARHAGESVTDLSSVSSAITVLYTVMMYLPGYTSFLPNYGDPYSKAKERDSSRRLLKDWVFSQLSYLAIFLMLICITEREAMTTDPLNFNVFSILFEIVSAYGNVGFSVGYSCKRLLKHDVYCKDASYGFVGKWSGKGKLILIVVMVFGRLKTFNLKGGSAWKLR